MLGKPNAAGIVVAGSLNPKWKGGKVTLKCEVCRSEFKVSWGRKDTARYCSMQCVGISQRGKVVPKKPPVTKRCRACNAVFSGRPSVVLQQVFCGETCHRSWRRQLHSGSGNPNWRGGASRLPYPYDFNGTSRRIRAMDKKCLNVFCEGTDSRLTVHHINHDKMDCRDENLITLCGACNSRANFKRKLWVALYTKILPFIRSGDIEINNGWQ